MKKRTMRLQQNITYGPVLSRRLGRSLGVNLLPPRRKVCLYDCIYCQYGHTEAYTATEGDFPTVDAVLSAIGTALCQYPYTDYVTFSGHGEATMHPRFGEIVAGVIALRDEIGAAAKVAILSNSALVTDAEMRGILAKLDARFMKLDAGDASIWRAVNRPAPHLHFDPIVAGLRALNEKAPIVVQSLILDGAVSNARGEQLENLLALLKAIMPREVHLYTVDRNPAESSVQRVAHTRLREIEQLAREEYGINATAY